MAAKHVPVTSSAISSVSWDPESKVLEVRMRSSGKVYSYPGVSEADHSGLMNASSMGKHLSSVIGPKYSTAAGKK